MFKTCKYPPGTTLDMPKFKPNIFISDCWSSVGNVTFYHKNGICYFRTKANGEFAGTEEQLENLSLHRRAIRAWQSLPHKMQLKWRELAKDVIAHRPPFDNTSHISGYNLFVSAYHGFAQLGQEHIPEPRPFEPFPIFSMDYIECKQSSVDELELTFRLTLCGVEDYSRYRVLGKIQMTTPGTGCHPGLMRNYLSDSVPDGSASLISFRLPKPISDSSTFQIHLRYILLDSITGYRSQYAKLSTLCELK